VKNPKWVSHGRWVVGKFSSARDFEAFIERWRAHFLDTMNPRYLDTWEVTHHTRTAPTEQGEGKEDVATEVGQEAKRSEPEQQKGRGKISRTVPAKPFEPKKIGVERSVYKWEEGQRWRVINVMEEEEAAKVFRERMKESGKAELTFATWNVLFDLYQPELIKTHIRVPVILDILNHTDAEIVGLQEVTVPFLEKLLAEDWVRRRYYVSEITRPEEGKEGREGSTIHPSGQVLLARYPFRLHFHAFNYHKSVVIGEFPSLFPGKRKLMVPVVHLTSEKSKSCVWQRKTQLDTIFRAVEQLGNNNKDEGGNNGEGGKGKCPSVDCVMIGDFNFKDGPENQNIRADCLDVWPALHPGDPGLTFDVSKNSLAYITSSSRLSRRFDRVLMLAGKEGSCKPLRIEMFATEPFYFDPALEVRELKTEEKLENEEREGQEKDGGEDKDIRKQVAEFKENLEAEILELPPTLNAEQRKMVHLLATRYGLKHFSKGDAKQGECREALCCPTPF